MVNTLLSDGGGGGYDEVGSVDEIVTREMRGMGAEEERGRVGVGVLL